MSNNPAFIPGDTFKDTRGSISFINDFQLDGVKRFYAIQPANINIIRAWQGHREEQKWFYVVAGSFKIVVVKIDNWEVPSSDPDIHQFDLNADNSGVLHIPGGYANGFKAIEPNSKVIVFSDFTVQQSANDEYRFDQNKWFDWELNKPK